MRGLAARCYIPCLRATPRAPRGLTELLASAAALRAHSSDAAAGSGSGATADAAAPDKLAPSAVCAAAISALSVRGVTKFLLSLGIDAVDARKLAVEKIDGLTLLELTLDELHSFKVPGGVAHTIVRAITPAAYETMRAGDKWVDLTVWQPVERPRDVSTSFMVHVSEDYFAQMFPLARAPLWVTDAEGTVLSAALTLGQAIEASRSGLRLLASRRYDRHLGGGYDSD